MIWFLLAWRNFLRNLNRSGFIILVIMVGAIATLIASSYINATYLLVKEGTIRGGVGHLQLALPDEFDGFEATSAQHGLTKQQLESTTSVLHRNAEIELVLPRLKFQGLISKGDNSLVFIGEGIQPKAERRLAGGFISIVAGQGLEYADPADPYQLVIGVELARLLDVKVGDAVSLMAVTSFGGVNALDATVMGISSSGSADMDRLQLYAPLELAQQLILTDKVSRLVLKLSDTNQTVAVQQQLQDLLPDLAVRNWQQLSPFYDQMVALYSRQFLVFGVILALVVLLTVLNSVMMAIFERKTELATLASLGIPPEKIQYSSIYEAVMLGFFACSAGAVLGYLLIILINAAGIQMPPPPGRNQGYQLLMLFRISDAYWVVFSGTVLSAFAAWWASRKISRFNITEVLHG
jgi:putative ABC transport system permease protein